MVISLMNSELGKENAERLGAARLASSANR